MEEKISEAAKLYYQKFQAHNDHLRNEKFREEDWTIWSQEETRLWHEMDDAQSALFDLINPDWS